MGVGSSSVRRALLVIAVAAGLWALALTITGGIAVDTTWRLISSRNPARPLLASGALIAWYLAVWRRHWRADLGPLAHPATWPPIIAGVTVATSLIVGIGWGTRIAAGPDQSGYVSQAAMLARGELTVTTPPWARDAPWDDAAASASPVGWRPATETSSLVPTYSPGLPLMLAAARKTFGRDAIFYVVPIMGALLVWSTYWLGLQLAGPWAGAIAAALVISSPTFLYMQEQIMSDVPVAALLTLSLAAALHGRYAWIAGVSAAAAVLVRPNLVPLVLVPLLVLVRGEGWLRRVLAFGTPVAVACAMVGALNWRYHGSPFESGYGQLTHLYAFDNIGPNLRQYGRWFVALHTPLALLGVLGVLVANADRWRTAIVTLGMPLGLLVLYMPYFVFHPNDWGYTRFLLPGYPSLFVGLGAAACGLAAHRRWRWLATTAAAVIVGIIAVHGWTVCITSGVFMQRVGDDRFARAVEYAQALPERSIFVSNAHSGTLHFYTGRGVLRFEAIRPNDLDVAAADLRQRGYALFLIGDEFEIEQFKTRFAGTRAAAALPKEPRANLGGVVVYDLNP